MGFSNRNKTTWRNADIRLNPEEFYEPGTNQQISNRELRALEALNDFMGHLCQVEALRREEWTKEVITELKALMRGQRIGRNSLDNLKIPGSASGRIVKTSIYGKERKSAVYLKIGKAEKSLIDFAKQAQNVKNWRENNIAKRRNGSYEM